MSAVESIIPMTLEAGTCLSRYRIEGLLGRGGMGEVYKARDEVLGRFVALKVIRDDLVVDALRLRRFREEATLASSLNHPHLVHVYDAGEIDGRRFIAMEYVDGRTFRAAMECHTTLARPLRYLLQAAEGLSKAHDCGIVHRDLKPENILVTADGYAKIVDFGLAKLLEGRSEEELLTAEGTVVGTLGYMAPEQVRGEDIDQRADIFAFGCILHETVTRERTFAGKTPYEVLHQIVNAEPPRLPATAGLALQGIVSRCLAKRREDRYRSMHDVVSDLREALVTIESDASAPTQPLPVTRRRRMPIRVAGAMIAAILLVVGVMALVQNFARTPRSSHPAMRPLSPEDAALRAKVILSSETRENADHAIALLQSAIAANPRYAPAFVELARAYSIKSFYYARADEQAQIEEDGRIAVENALALDPKLGSAYVVKGRLLWTHSNRFPHDLAIRAYRQAIALDPHLDEAHHQLALVEFHVGLLDEAEKELNAALAIDPSNTLARLRFGVIAIYRGNYEDALATLRSTPLQKNPSLWAFQMATALYRSGRPDEAMALLNEYLQKDPRDEGGTGTSVRAMLLAAGGKRREALDAIARAERLGEGFGHFHHTAYNIGSAYALLGQTADAVKWLEVAADDGFPCYPLFAKDTNLDSLRHDVRFVALLSRIKVQMSRCAAATRR
jgi:serine/threonine protein kinase